MKDDDDLLTYIEWDRDIYERQIKFKWDENTIIDLSGSWKHTMTHDLGFAIKEKRHKNQKIEIMRFAVALEFSISWPNAILK